MQLAITGVVPFRKSGPKDCTLSYKFNLPNQLTYLSCLSQSRTRESTENQSIDISLGNFWSDVASFNELVV